MIRNFLNLKISMVSFFMIGTALQPLYTARYCRPVDTGVSSGQKGTESPSSFRFTKFQKYGSCSSSNSGHLEQHFGITFTWNKTSVLFTDVFNDVTTKKCCFHVILKRNSSKSKCLQSVSYYHLVHR